MSDLSVKLFISQCTYFATLNRILVLSIIWFFDVRHSALDRPRDLGAGKVLRLLSEGRQFDVRVEVPFVGDRIYSESWL